MNRRQLLGLLAGTSLGAAVSACDPTRKIKDLEEMARLANMPDNLPVEKPNYNVPKSLQGKIDEVVKLLKCNYDVHSISENPADRISGDTTAAGKISVENYRRKVSNPPHSMDIKLTIQKDEKGKENAYLFRITEIPKTEKDGAYFQDWDADGLKRKFKSPVRDAQEVVSVVKIDPATGKIQYDGLEIPSLTQKSVDQLNRNYERILTLILQSADFYKPGKRKEEGIAAVGLVR